jgi:transglutaminase-like putative cysteine protease
LNQLKNNRYKFNNSALVQLLLYVLGAANLMRGFSEQLEVTAVWLRTRCDITFDVAISTPFILMLRPRSGLNQWVARESYTINPSVPVIEYTDSYGNLCQRLIAPPGVFSIHTSADILTADCIDVSAGAPFDEVQYLPNDVLTYLLPTRYCESDRFIDLGQKIVVGVMPGYDQVAAIVAWIRDNIQFNSDSISIICGRS